MRGKNSPEDDYEFATVVVGALLWPSSWRASVECRVKEKTKKAIEWEDREKRVRFNAGINWNTKRCQSIWRVYFRLFSKTLNGPLRDSMRELIGIPISICVNTCIRFQICE